MLSSSSKEMTESAEQNHLNDSHQAPGEENSTGSCATVKCSENNGNSVNKLSAEDSKSDHSSSALLHVALASVIASVGGILFGYDIGIISGALLLLRDEFSLSCFEQEMVVSSVLIGAFCASFFGGNIVDQFGRKPAIMLSSLLFIGGALLLSFSINIAMLITGRLIVGFAISISVTAECTYISEISPRNRRGMMVSLNEVGITIGFLFAYLLNYIFISYEHGWQYMFGAAVIPAALQAFGIMFMPSSPHYLVIKGKVEKAQGVLKQLRRNSRTDEEIKAIILALQEEKKRKYCDLFSSTNNMRGRMALGMMLVFLQQLSGHANVLYYAPTVFQYFGYCSDTSATLVTVGLGVVKVGATGFTVLIVDRLGRRFLLLVGCIMMATSIMVLGMLTVINPSEHSYVKCHVNEINTFRNNISLTNQNISQEYDFSRNHELIYESSVTSELKNRTISSSSNLHNAEVTSNICYNCTYKNYSANYNSSSQYGLVQTASLEVEPTTKISICVNCSMLYSGNNTEFEQIRKNDTCSGKSEVSLAMKLISVISLMTFVCAYGISYGPVTWLVLSEIFPTALRGRAISVATCVNWGANILVSLSFLDLLDAVGVGETFILYGCICFGAAAFVFFCLPETKNKSLEEITCLLRKGFVQRKIKPCASSVSRNYNVSETRI